MKKSYNTPVAKLICLGQDEAIAAGSLMNGTSGGDGYVFDFDEM